MQKITFASCIGNLLEHYDLALFGLTAPVLAPLFFPKTTPLSALMYTYALLVVGIISRPIGSFVFGFIGDLKGRKPALILSITGMACTTTFMGLIPTYATAGALAPLLLIVGRLLQGFFAAGEAVGGAIVVLENAPEKTKNFLSSCFDASSMAGILLASFFVTLLSWANLLETHWRLLYWLGAFTACAGTLLRTLLPNMPSQPIDPSPLPWKPFLSIFLATGFSYTTYNLSFTLLNGYVPLISSIPFATLMHSNTLLLAFDLVLLLFFGWMATWIRREYIMMSAAFLLSIVAIPLFMLLSHPTTGNVLLIRLVIITLGVAFAAPFYAWANSLLPYQWRYRTISLAIAFGSQLLGNPVNAISLWLYENTGCIWAPGAYLALLSFCGGLAVVLPFIVANKLTRSS